MGCAALWMASQTVQADGAGNYTVIVGSTSPQGLPPDLFSSGQARWLGVQAQGKAYEQPRLMLLSARASRRQLAWNKGGEFLLRPDDHQSF
jgi:hypothetical protein